MKRRAGAFTGCFLAEARDCLSRASELPFPAGFISAATWAMHQRQNRDIIARFTSDVEAIHYAEYGNQTGFDHRITDRDYAAVVSSFKHYYLGREFSRFSFDDHPRLAESPYSRPDSLVKVADRTVSSIFLTHLYYYLRINDFLPDVGEPLRVLEIGSGYGGLARIFKIIRPRVQYTLIDLPESLFFAQIFLRTNFPDANIRYLSAPGALVSNEWDFLLVPVQLQHELKGQKYDVAINTGSFQEMTEEAVRSWMEFIEQSLCVDFLYSFNYFLVNRRRHGETSRGAVSPICPILDPYWRARYFAINPSIPTVDATTRNWLEVVLERCKKNSTPGGSDPRARASQHYEAARCYPITTNPWFENIWMAIWCEPRRQYIEDMLCGIALFARGNSFGITNYVGVPRVRDTVIGAFFRKNSSYMGSALERLLSKPQRATPTAYLINIRTGKFENVDVGFLRHNYYFLKYLKKKVAARVKNPSFRSQGTNDYSEIDYYKRLLRQAGC